MSHSLAPGITDRCDLRSIAHEIHVTKISYLVRKNISDMGYLDVEGVNAKSGNLCSSSGKVLLRQKMKDAEKDSELDGWNKSLAGTERAATRPWGRNEP